MFARDIAFLLVMSGCVYLGGAVAGVVALTQYDMEGGIKGLTVTHSIFGTIEAMVVWVILISDPNAIKSKITCLNFVLVLNSLLGVLGGALALAGANQFTAWRFNSSASTYPILLMFGSALFELVLVFANIRANESLKEMTGTDDYPTASLSAYVCGDGPEESDDETGLLEDAHIGHGGRRKGKQSFNNRTNEGTRKQVFKPRRYDEDSSRSSEEETAMRGQVISKY